MAKRLWPSLHFCCEWDFLLIDNTCPVPVEPGDILIRPGILLPNGITVYPTGLEWIIAWAIRGVPWAEKALDQYISDEGHRWAGDDT